MADGAVESGDGHSGKERAMLRNILRPTAAMLAACAALAVLAAPAVAGETPVPGVWQRHEYLLSYAGFTSHYSCEGIEDKLKLLLKAAGARDDVHAIGSCSNPSGGPSQIASARVTFYTLVLQSAAALASTPRPVTRPAAVPEPGIGAWKTVEFRAGRPNWLEEGDCELVEQFDHELLPLFTTRNRDSHMTCVPHQRVLGGIALRFETLAPLPKAVAGHDKKAH
jgi:hypothetical protein